MKTFVCLKCRHIAFNNAPVDCPVCGSPIENYEEAPDILHRANAPDSHKREGGTHLPLVSLTHCNIHDEGCKIVSVDVGEKPHVMESEHFIHFIDIYLDKRYIGRMNYTHLYLKPSFSFHIDTNKGNLRLVSYCNKHGYWTRRIEIRG